MKRVCKRTLSAGQHQICLFITKAMLKFVMALSPGLNPHIIKISWIFLPKLSGFLFNFNFAFWQFYYFCWRGCLFFNFAPPPISPFFLFFSQDFFQPISLWVRQDKTRDREEGQTGEKAKAKLEETILWSLFALIY